MEFEGDEASVVDGSLYYRGVSGSLSGLSCTSSSVATFSFLYASMARQRFRYGTKRQTPCISLTIIRMMLFGAVKLVVRRLVEEEICC